MTVRRTAANIIAFHFGWDIKDMTEQRYQPTRYSSPSIYSLDQSYFAAPSNNQPPKNMKGNWKVIGEHYGRKVFELTQENAAQ